MKKLLNIDFTNIIYFLRLVVNIALLIIGVGVCIMLFVEAIDIAKLIIDTIQYKVDYTEVIKEFITFFLYFEFVSLIIKYFDNQFHFPLRYFIYIGITAMVRLIIIDHSNSFHMLLWGATILLLCISLAIVNKYVKHD